MTNWQPVWHGFFFTPSNFPGLELFVNFARVGRRSTVFCFVLPSFSRSLPQLETANAFMPSAVLLTQHSMKSERRRDMPSSNSRDVCLSSNLLVGVPIARNHCFAPLGLNCHSSVNSFLFPSCGMSRTIGSSQSPHLNQRS